ncbi:MAG: GGDEF domain-containing protein [Syntrophobacter sp.]
MDKISSKIVCPTTARECPLASELEQLREKCRILEDLSYVDALTGIYNFRYMQRALDMEMERTRRSRLPTSLVMADLDYFKRINDEFGHEEGNEALAHIGRVLHEGVRVIDIPCRYGGEEFALILPSTSLVQASKIAERLRIAISSSPVVLRGRRVTITASFGVASFSHFDDWTVGEFLRKADNFLYHAKSSGRNRVWVQEISPVLPDTGVTREEKDILLAPSEAGDK